jgi:hypothetical protein
MMRLKWRCCFSLALKARTEWEVVGLKSVHGCGSQGIVGVKMKTAEASCCWLMVASATTRSKRGKRASTKGVCCSSDGGYHRHRGWATLIDSYQEVEATVLQQDDVLSMTWRKRWLVAHRRILELKNFAILITTNTSTRPRCYVHGGNSGFYCRSSENHSKVKERHLDNIIVNTCISFWGNMAPPTTGLSKTSLHFDCAKNLV